MEAVTTIHAADFFSFDLTGTLGTQGKQKSSRVGAWNKKHTGLQPQEFTPTAEQTAETCSVTSKETQESPSGNT